MQMVVDKLDCMPIINKTTKKKMFDRIAVDTIKCVKDSVPSALSKRVPRLENVKPINSTEKIPLEKKVEKIGRHTSPCKTNNNTLLNV